MPCACNAGYRARFADTADDTAKFCCKPSSSGAEQTGEENNILYHVKEVVTYTGKTPQVDDNGCGIFCVACCHMFHAGQEYTHHVDNVVTHQMRMLMISRILGYEPCNIFD